MSAGKLLTLKTVIAVIGLSGGSVALASATGNLPAQLGGHPTAASSASSSASARTDAQDRHRPPATPSPSPAMRGLCHAYTAGAGSNPGKALDNPAFSALISAAGSKEKVTSYCKGNVASGKPAAHPTPGSGSHPANNSGGGNSDSGANSAHVSNKPAKAHGHPSPHPTGKPSLHPAAP
jgi:pyruvate/2-oxoglutarate dehydrogenase complex dihydrolipoamide acyltransferase (E2) component